MFSFTNMAARGAPTELGEVGVVLGQGPKVGACVVIIT
jgi:hypothetical protein